MTQLAFELPSRVALGRADFYVSASNAAAVAWIDRWPDWPGPLVLCGPEGCGKSHLAQLWQARAGAAWVAGARLDERLVPRLVGAAVAVDDAETAPEAVLLHLYNVCLERGGRLLLTARRPPGAWPIALPDLRSRLRAALAVPILPPDDALLAAVLVKHFSDRQLRVAPDVIRYLVARMERSFAAAAALAARLDRAALSLGRPVTLPLVRRMLAAPDQSSSNTAGGR